MDWKDFFDELKRRSVIKSTIAYLAVAWIILQIASILFPVFDAPDYSLKVLIYVLSFGLIMWIIVSWIYDMTPDGLRRTEDIGDDNKVAELTDKRLNRVIAISLSIAVLLLVIISFWAGSRWQPKNDMANNTKIAVFPFETEMVSDAQGEDEYYSVLSEMLIDELSKVDMLDVINRHSIKMMSAGISSGNSLLEDVLSGIDFYITGSVNQNGNEILLILQLKEGVDTDPVWKKSYSRDVSEIRMLLGDAANDVTMQLGIDLPEEEDLLWSDLRRVNPETFGLYLKGRHFLNKSTAQDWQRGLVYMEEAVDRNPADPDAYAYLAEAYITLGHGPDPPPDVFPKALSAAQRAIQLDSTVALGWAALSHYHTYFGKDWALAEYAFERADRLNPNLADNHYHRAWFLALFGRMNEAISEHKRAQELDPFAPLNTAWLGELYRMVGRYEEGIIETEKASLMEDDYALSLFIKGRILMDQQEVDQAIEMFSKASEVNTVYRYLGLCPALIRSGRLTEGKEILEEFEKLPLNGFRALLLASIYSYLGDFDKSIEYLNYPQKHGWFPWIRIIFINPDMKEDPRYLKIIRDMNLPDPAPLAYDPGNTPLN